MPTKIEISYKTILFIVFLIILLWFLVQIRQIIFLVFVAFILMSALKPLVDTFEKYHIPRGITVGVFYIILLALLAFSINAILPPLVVQTIHLGENLPIYIKSVAPFISFDLQTITQQITPVGENLLKVTVGLFSNIVTFFTLFVISFYLLMERKFIRDHLSSFLGGEGTKYIMSGLTKVEERLGAWVRGQLTLAITIGLGTFIGLTLLGIPFTLPLAIFAGILEIVPIVGPIISAIPAILVAVTISPVLALACTALYFIVQQMEAHLIVPFVMRKAVGMPPLVTIIALLIGAQLNGVIGALLAVPLVVTIETIISEYLKIKGIK